MKPEIYHLPGKEIHMVGDYVGVVWNTSPIKKQIIGSDGLTYTAVVSGRVSAPYIDFLDIRENHGEYYEDEDSPVQGGIDADFASKIAAELITAIEYLKEAKDG